MTATTMRHKIPPLLAPKRTLTLQVLSNLLYERVSVVLKSHGLGHFSDLCSAEQVTLLEEAHREIMSEDNKVGCY